MTSPQWTRRNLLKAGGAVALAGLGTAAHISHEADKALTVQIEGMGKNLVAMHDVRSTGEILHRYSIKDIMKGLHPLDVFPIERGGQERAEALKVASMNTSLPRPTYATTFSSDYKEGTLLDLAIADRSAQDSIDAKDGNNLTHLVKAMMEAGASPTEQTMRLVDERIKRSLERAKADPSGYFVEAHKKYNWAQDAQIMQDAQRLLRAKYRPQETPAR